MTQAAHSRPTPQTEGDSSQDTTRLAALGLLALAACQDQDETAWPAAAGHPSQAQPGNQMRRRSAVGPSARVPDAQTLMDWAERAYPQYFPSHESNREEAPYTYRYYPGTGNYLGVADGAVYIFGPVSGNTLTRVGQLSDFSAQVFPRFAPQDRAQAARFLLQAQFAARDTEIDAVMGQGFEAWLEAQFSVPPGPATWDWLVGRGYAEFNEQRYYSGGHPYFDFAAWKQILSAEDALRVRIQLALTEILVVSLNSATAWWPHLVYATYWDGLGQHAFGNYRDLLEHVSTSVAMGKYLSILYSVSDPATGRVPDENYARELMQLFTIGLYQLNPDGSVKRDAAGRPLETYTARDITGLARVFTGYVIDDSGEKVVTSDGSIVSHPTAARRTMKLEPSRHTRTGREFLGCQIPNTADGHEARRLALDHLFQHPNVGPFIGRQFIQRLVTSDPSPAYVARVAAAFNNNGSGVRGDMKALISAVLLDEEARGAAGLANPQFGKLSEPALRFAQWGRTFGVRSRSGAWKFNSPNSNPVVNNGQRLFWSPSVFNFFRPGFVPPGTAMAQRGATAPEFQIVDESTVAGYVNGLELMVEEGPWIFAPERPDIDQSRPSSQSGTDDMKPDYSAELALVLQPEALIDRLNLLLCAGRLSQTTRRQLVNALNSEPIQASSPDWAKRRQVARAVLMVMVCPEYLVQK
ncbi:DUF1800 domain-containing protein [Inhella proteolytica]|uniref:DUF1800 family protein n=1 Tax=Inhella proteolytica TaxID=2795029 RepID=A0A931J9F3_9BURK|nr:DUF1800 family protein [Inhella proteolytica]MBH9579222.1 DUF1800 family protein [Inhella proteolytica]